MQVHLSEQGSQFFSSILNRLLVRESGASLRPGRRDEGLLRRMRVG